MKPLATALTALVLLAACTHTRADQPTTAPPTLTLTDTFQSMLAQDGTLLGWYAMAQRPKKDHPDTQDAQAIFTAKDDLIHVYAGAKPNSPQTIATLTTRQSFSEYVFEIDYCWLGPRFAPRTKHDRDAGVLFHLYPEQKQVWPVCVECQIGESKFGGNYVSGDLWVIGKENKLDMPQKNKRFAPLNDGGELVELAGKAYMKGTASTAAHKPGVDVWNTIRVIVKADQYAIFQVNGRTVNEVYNMQRKIDGRWQPLTSGPISLQAEYAEMLYRNPRIRKILPSDAKPSAQSGPAR